MKKSVFHVKYVKWNNGGDAAALSSGATIPT